MSRVYYVLQTRGSVLSQGTSLPEIRRALRAWAWKGDPAWIRAVTESKSGRLFSLPVRDSDSASDVRDRLAGMISAYELGRTGNGKGENDGCNNENI